jgi:hypothetical protein
MAASHPFLPFAAKLCPSSRSAKFRDSEPALGSVDFTGRRSIVSRRVGKNLWRQVFRVTFSLKSGTNVQAVVVSDASSDECSMSDAQVFLVSKVL